MKLFARKTIIFMMTAIAIAVAASYSTKSFAWGDNGGGRPSYTIDQINHGVLGKNIVFNSISDNPAFGDEKNFVGARENTGVNVGAGNIWDGNDITVEDGKEYYVRLYVHNNNPNIEDALSRNTRVAFNIPTKSANQIQINGYIFSDNANPSEYWDYVNFNSDHTFHLEYIYGSAIIENNGVKQLSDEIVTKAASQNGIQIGYSDLDGEIPGGLAFACYVSIRVKVVYDNIYTVSQSVRKANSTNWSDSGIEAKVGDKVEIQIAYENIDEQCQNDVIVKAFLPQNLHYITGSTRLYNTNYPSGTNVLNDDVISTGINLGHYDPNANASVRLTAEVIDEELEPGSNILVSWAQIGVGLTTQQDYAAVKIQKAKVPDVILIILDGMIATCLIFFIVLCLRSRKNKRA